MNNFLPFGIYFGKNWTMWIVCSTIYGMTYFVRSTLFGNSIKQEKSEMKIYMTLELHFKVVWWKIFQMNMYVHKLISSEKRAVFCQFSYGKIWRIQFCERWKYFNFRCVWKNTEILKKHVEYLLWNCFWWLFFYWIVVFNFFIILDKIFAILFKLISRF